MCNKRAVSTMLVLAFIENIAAYLTVVQRNQDENQQAIDTVLRYMALVRSCPALSAGNTRIARRQLAELLGEKEED